MQYDFLKHFPRRMKSVGLHFMLIQNSIQKTTWKQYGFSTGPEQINIIFAVLLYIMEQSLREESPGCQPRAIPARGVLCGGTERKENPHPAPADTTGRSSGQHLPSRRGVP